MNQIYKIDSKGKTRVWYMEQDGDRYRTFDGILGGKVKASEWRTAHPTNVGRSNERNGVEQAAFEIAAAYEKKLSREYHRTVEDAAKGAHFFKPMLAEKYTSFSPGYIQPKLDGVRAIITNEGIFSRQGKPLPGAPHVFEALKPLFDEHPDLVFDGELYNHDLKDDFNSLVSLIKKGGQRDERVQFHCYDLPAVEDVYEFRWETLSQLLDERAPAIQIVETQYVSDEELFDSFHAEWVSRGYEGSIWRCPNSNYMSRRTKALLKRKDFDDGEFELVRLEEGQGNWAGAAKRAVFWLPGAERDAGPTIDNTFEAGIRGTWERNRALLDEDHKVATVRHFGWTPSEIPKPRFGVVTQFHGNGRNV